MYYTKEDLKNLSMLILENEDYLSNFTSTSELLAEEIYKIVKLDNRFTNSKKWDEWYKWIVKIMIVKCSDKYHDIFKHSEHAHLRELIAKSSDKYHDYFKNDNYHEILEYIAKKSDKYHDHFKNSEYDSVRYIVAKYSNKYDDYFKNDQYWRIQKILNSRKIENKKDYILDRDKSYKISFINNTYNDWIIDKLKIFGFNILRNYNVENSCLFISTIDNIKIACWDTIEKFQEPGNFYKKISIKKFNKLFEEK